MNNLVIIVQARFGGSRFPGKVLAPLLGQPMLLWQLDRLSRLQTPHTLVVACPSTPGNEQIQDLCTRHGYACALVDVAEQDVLARYQAVAEGAEAEEIVRLTGDCPLVDPQVIDRLISYHHWPTLPRPDHTGIAAEWPDGQDAEIFSRNALERAYAEATLPSDREHVTAFLYRHPERFTLATFPCPFHLSWQQYSVDTPQDLDDVERLLDFCLDRFGPTFGWREIWQAIRCYKGIEVRMSQRVRNQAYVEQVAQEQGWATVPTWDTLRYGDGA